jgi:hypothetical protein
MTATPGDFQPIARPGATDSAGVPRSLAGRGVLSKVETWRELPGGEIEFTMKRLRSTD